MRLILGLVEKLYDGAADSDIGFYVSVLRGQAMHCHAGFTVAAYNGNGLGSGLHHYMEHHARAHGFETTCAEAIHPATRHIWSEKCGYSVLSSFVLAEYEESGSKPLAALDHKEEVALCVKDIHRSSCWFCCPTLFAAFTMYVLGGCCPRLASCCCIGSFQEPGSQILR